MSDLTHLFHIGQQVRCKLDDNWHNGTVKETYTDHIIVDIPEVSDHCWFETGLNICDVQPVYMYYKMKAVNIKWDTDGNKKVFNSLPQEVEIPSGMKDPDEISDWLSDEFGFCHNGFDIDWN